MELFSFCNDMNCLSNLSFMVLDILASFPEASWLRFPSHLRPQDRSGTNGGERPKRAPVREGGNSDFCSSAKTKVLLISRNLDQLKSSFE